MKDLEKISEELLSEMSLREFPDGYLGQERIVSIVEVPVGKEVMMYREHEGIFVMVDNERIFFKDPYEAKYVYYCAKRGISRIRMPESRVLKIVIKEFQADLENLRSSVDDRIKKSGLSDAEKEAIIEKCSEKLGYRDIMDV